MKHPILHHLLLGALLACADAALAERYPLSVRSCEREVTFERAPSRAVSHDINLTEMMVALGLQTRMVGYTGISGWWKNADPGLIAALAAARAGGALPHGGNPARCRRRLLLRRLGLRHARRRRPHSGQPGAAGVKV